MHTLRHTPHCRCWCLHYITALPSYVRAHCCAVLRCLHALGLSLNVLCPACSCFHLFFSFCLLSLLPYCLHTCTTACTCLPSACTFSSWELLHACCYHGTAFLHYYHFHAPACYHHHLCSHLPPATALPHCCAIFHYHTVGFYCSALAFSFSLRYAHPMSLLPDLVLGFHACCTGHHHSACRAHA